jgi:hypothetical protein
MRTTVKFVTCASIALVVALISAGTASASVYAGETAQHAAIAITLAKNGQVKSVALNWDAACKSGSTYTFGRVLIATKKKPSIISPGDNPLLAVVKKGKLTGTAFGVADFGDTGSGAISQKFSGKFKPNGASGTLSAQMVVLDGGGTQIDTCSSGTVHWGAVHGPTAYGGSTTQGEPVVVITKKNRSKVDYFGFGWQADCLPEGSDFWHIGDELGNFPLTGNGAFGGTFSNDYPYRDGSGKNTFTYKINGSLRKKGGSGTVSVHVVEADAGGNATSTCDTTPVQWSVTR